MPHAVRVGIVGLGHGVKVHGDRLLQPSPEFDIIGVCATSAERVQGAAERYGARGYTDYGEMLENEDIELVVVATPGAYHADMAVAAMRKGKHVVVEKPMATTLADADRMIETAAEQHVWLSVFHQRRYDGGFLTVRKALEQGLLGTPFLIETRAMKYGPVGGASVSRPTWRQEASTGGGRLNEWGPHLIDWVLALVKSEPEEVFCDLQSRMWKKDADDHFTCFIRFRDRTIAQVQASQDARLPMPKWYILGDKGCLLGEGTIESEPGYWERFTVRTEKHGRDETFDLDLEKGRWERYYEGLYRALTQDVEPDITLAQSRRVMEIIEAARQSAATGTTVRLRQTRDPKGKG